MSKYTTEVRFICEQYAGKVESADGNSVEAILEASRSKVFNFKYPIFDEDYRSGLEIKILRHFYTREISEETVGLWKLRLNSKMNEIMPYYNQLYKSELLEFNPLYTHNLTRKYERGVDGTVDGTLTVTNETSGTVNGTRVGSVNEWDKYSDTPQGGLSGIESDTYLTNARNIKSENSNTGNEYSNERSDGSQTDNTKSKSTEEYLESVSGYEGVKTSSLIKEYRETFLNIDMMIIDELESLFMQLW